MTRVQDKLAKIEALIERATSAGERQAALLAKQRLLEKQCDLPVEFKIFHHNLWKKKLFLALCEKYELAPYRHKRQKKTTTLVQVSPSLMNNYLWPEYQSYVALFEELVQDVFDELILKMQPIHSPSSPPLIPSID